MPLPSALPTDEPGSTRPLLGFWMCLALVVGNMIGSGIFLLPAALAPYGLNALVGWGVTISGSLCLAAVLAALARALPDAAGPYDYVRIGLGAPAAFFVMWAYWISLWVTNAALSIAAVSYLSTLSPATFAVSGAPALAAIGFVILFIAVSCGGVRATGSVQVVTSFLKVLPLVAAVVIALLVIGGGGEPAQAAQVSISPGGVAGAAALTLWAMLGFESATVPAGKVRDPERNVPLTTLLGTLIAGLFYVAASGAVFLLLPAETAARSNAPFADLIGLFWGPWAASLVVLFAAISCLGALNGWVFLQAEVPLTLARRGIFPGFFRKVNRRGIPVRGQIFGGVLTILLIAANYTRGMTELFAFMALLATAATLVLYLLASITALVLTMRRTLKLGPITVLALIGGAYSVWTLWGAGAEATGWGAVLLATGIPVYLIMRFGRSSPAPVGGPVAPPGSAAEALPRSS
ncbi:amino acid permease [Sphingosinicella terrae]|uniref:amino acid permease n=1 Tax=Sphingosinicella terrae TaxID=2172047 RepID=UPI000E0D75D7|nr:amino acid permease [Sphingosinicella terrae]